MWTSGFFDSINDDRLYNATQLSSIFEGLISSGVYLKVGNKLAVQPNSEMTIKINTGRGWFGGRWVNNDANEILEIEAADPISNRYCAVCVRVDLTTEARKAEPYLKYSAFATNPTKPTMERTDSVKEYCLAYVYIPANATSITAENIEDTRGNSDLCGWVSVLVDQPSSTNIFEQFEALFLEWFNGLKNYLDDNVEAKITADVAKLNATAPIKATGTFDGLGWDSQPDGTYLQTVTVPGVTERNDILVAPTDEFRDAYIAMGCEAIAQGENSITFECEKPDDINMKIKVIIFNDELQADFTE